MTRQLSSLTLTLTCVAMLAVACDDSPGDTLDQSGTPDPSIAAQGDDDVSHATSEVPPPEVTEEELRTGGFAGEPHDDEPRQTDEETDEDPEGTPDVQPDEGLEVIDTVLALEGALVIPQTLLHLESEAANCEGQATGFEWAVNQPDGSASHLKPHSAFPTPTFEANVAGEYSFELRSFGQDGALCTPPRHFLLSVVPTSALHIELLWHTPEDPDETDEGPEAGSDLDLHVTRLWAEEEDTAWFDVPFDCFWFNANPNWGSLDPTVDDDPSLDRDDTNGAGPENLNLNTTEEDASYGVMVHLWRDHGYGTSLATIRIYVMGELIYEMGDVSLNQHDAWEVGTLSSALKFTAAEDDEGGAVILKGFTPESFMAVD